GIVDQNVQAACALDCVFNDGLGGRGVTEIDRQAVKVVVLSALGGQHLCALVAQTAGDGPADAGAPAGDQGDFACVSFHGNPVVILATAYRGSRLPGSPPRVPPVNLLPADPPGPHFLFSGPRHARIPSFRPRRLLPADGPPVGDRG